MSSISVKRLLKKLQKTDGIKFRSADFIPKRGEKVEQAIVYYSVEGISWTPELVYIDNSMFNWADWTKLTDVVCDETFGLANRVLRYTSFDLFDAKVLDIECKVIVHNYYSSKLGMTMLQPVFVIMNEELLGISDIKEQFKN